MFAEQGNDLGQAFTETIIEGDQKRRTARPLVAFIANPLGFVIADNSQMLLDEDKIGFKLGHRFEWIYMPHMLWIAISYDMVVQPDQVPTDERPHGTRWQ